jgi:hypothetical protein
MKILKKSLLTWFFLHSLDYCHRGKAPEIRLPSILCKGMVESEKYIEKEYEQGEHPAFGAADDYVRVFAYDKCVRRG